MKPRSLLILLVLVVGLGSFIAFFERKLPSSEERERRAKKIFSFGPRDVRSLAIERQGAPLAFERIEKPEKAAETSDESAPAAESITAADWKWRIVHPIAANADSPSVGRLVDTLAGLERSSTIDDVDPKATGLDHPEAKVRLKTGEGVTVLEVGARVPVGGERIVRIEGEKEAYSVPDAFWNELIREPGSWRDKQIYSGDREAIQRISIRPGSSNAPAGEVVLARHPDGFWIERPIADRADRDLVEALLSDVTGLTADRFVETPASPAEMGLEPPRGTIEVVAKPGEPSKPFQLDLGGSVGAAADGEAPSTYARAGGQLFTTKSRVGEALMRGAEEWRSHAVTGMEVYQIDSLQVEDPAGSFVVKRAGSDWQRGKDTISYTPVSDLLYALSELKAEKLDASAVPGGKPTLAATLVSSDGRKETVRFYATPAGAVARTDGRETTLELAAGKLAEIQAKVADVRKEKPVAKTAAKP